MLALEDGKAPGIDGAVEVEAATWDGGGRVKAPFWSRNCVGTRTPLPPMIMPLEAASPAADDDAAA